ncbi:predicted protein [Sclerotinia sclerotiorum 1980 UF-70]|uniref:Uncharacterized protein n=1 Tax=Sclerotinia sclerotiorum (strain ATCC 18683 / 1980 / Ss-1) TaxID=665079 RepID=A7EUN1_SCLS1|nr:predicted protein [Sclerotinia sclerotiorum 1980 UF-70]EDN93173.1 predicted protein [Sclerotinia sclerotiorum 1980 UF-70]
MNKVIVSSREIRTPMQYNKNATAQQIIDTIDSVYLPRNWRYTLEACRKLDLTSLAGGRILNEGYRVLIMVINQYGYLVLSID